MKAAAFQYTRPGGWSEPFPALDGPQTLVVVFGAPSFMDEPGPALTDIAAAFSSSVVIGCSSAGEVFGQQVCDETLAVAVM
jgi:small ligand-binding sensory domain FIST